MNSYYQYLYGLTRLVKNKGIVYTLLLLDLGFTCYNFNLKAIWIVSYGIEDSRIIYKFIWDYRYKPLPT